MLQQKVDRAMQLSSPTAPAKDNFHDNPRNHCEDADAPPARGSTTFAKRTAPFGSRS